MHVWSSRAVVRAPAAWSGGAAGVSHAVEGCPAEGCPAELSGGSGVQGSCFGVQFMFFGTKQKQNKNKMKREKAKKSKKIKQMKTRKRERSTRANTICSTSANFDFGQSRHNPLTPPSNLFNAVNLPNRMPSITSSETFPQKCVDLLVGTQMLGLLVWNPLSLKRRENSLDSHWTLSLFATSPISRLTNLAICYFYDHGLWC